MIKLNAKLAKRLKKEQKEVLIKAIEKGREIPIRVVYTQKYWDDIAKDSNYQLATREISSLKKYIDKVAKNFSDKKINIIHLGVGNGVEIPILIDSFGIENLGVYSIVDINKTMLDISGTLLKEKYPKIKVKKFCQDIETYGIKKICQETKKSGAKTNIIILIANGVLFANEQFVKEINKNLGEDDYFLLSLELYKKGKEEEIVKPYLIPSVLDLLSNGVKLLNYEVKYDFFSAELDKKNNWLNVYFSPNGEKEKRLLVLRSYKPTIKILTERMNKLGFQTLQIHEQKEFHTCVGLYKKIYNKQ